MSVHTREDLERIGRYTRRHYSHALMSDTKWRKLFDAVNESGWHPSHVVMKFVGSDEPEDYLMRWPDARNFWGPPQWVDTAEYGGPIELRGIEWLMIPPFVVNQHGKKQLPEVPQDFAAIEAALARVGQFPLEHSAEGLKIIGYR